MPNPPTTSVTWTVCNRTPATWSAVIEGWVAEYHFTDGSQETVNRTADRLPSNFCTKGKGTQIKCLDRCHVVMKVRDPQGLHLFDKWVTAGEFGTVCPTEHISVLGPAFMSKMLSVDFGEEAFSYKIDSADTAPFPIENEESPEAAV